MAERRPGGYTCCVPGCFFNSKKDEGQFSFYVFPKDPKGNGFLTFLERILHQWRLPLLRIQASDSQHSAQVQQT